MKNSKKCLALFTTICLMLTACDNAEMQKVQMKQSLELIGLAEITVDIPNKAMGNGSVLTAGGIQVILDCAKNAVVWQENEAEAEPENEIEIEADIEAESERIQEICDRKATVTYAGESFLKRTFAVGGDMLYVAGKTMDGSDFFGSMKSEDDTFTYFTVEMPENMQVLNMTVDTQGSCHMLWVSAQRQVLDGVEQNIMDFEKCSITKVNAAGELEAVMDVSDIFAEKKMRPYCFITDKNGCYYLDSGNEIIQLYPDGSIAAHIACAGKVEVIGCAKDESVYCIYMTENGEELIGCVEADRVTDCGVSMPEVDAGYSNMVAGTDTDLLVFNKEGGVFTYDTMTNTFASRVADADLPVEGQEIAGSGFLGDGRLCLMVYKEEQIVFHYIPAGK